MYTNIQIDKQLNICIEFRFHYLNNTLGEEKMWIQKYFDNGKCTREPNVAPEIKEYDFVPEMQSMMEQLLKKLRIAVVFGGDKNREGAVMYTSHNSRPWKSYEQVAVDIRDSLKEIGFQHVSLFPSDMTLLESLKKDRTHIVWLNTGGMQGYNPVCHTPAILEMLGVPYIGESSINATVLDSKHIFKKSLIGLGNYGVFSSPFITWNPKVGKMDPRRNRSFRTAFGNFPGPFVVKPVSGRASLHVYKVDTVEELPQYIDEVYRNTRNCVLIEKFLSGREYCVAIFGKTIAKGTEIFRRQRQFTFSHIERVFEEGEQIFTSMDKKAITKNRARLLDPQREGKIIQQLNEISWTVYSRFFLNGLVRLDIREDENGRLNVLEANPKPDLKKNQEGVMSLISMGLYLHGLTYNDLIYSLVVDRLYDILVIKNELQPHISDLLELRVRNSA